MATALKPVGSTPGLDTHLTQLAWFDLSESTLKLRHQRSEKLDLIAVRDQHNNGDIPPDDRLLVPEFPIDGYKHLELRLGETEQFAVLLTCPAHLGSRVDIVARELSPQTLRHAFVKQQSHVE